MTLGYSLLILYLTANGFYASKICDLSDNGCLTKSFNIILPKIAEGIPELGVKSSDPVFIKKVTGVFPKLMYIFSDTNFEGYKNCKVTNATFNSETTKFVFHLLCPSLTVKGHYEMHGEIFGMLVDGKGNGTVITENIHIQVDADIEKYKGKDGREHIILKNIQTGLHERTFVKINFQHINKENDEIAAKISKLLDENWLPASKLAEGPVFRFAMKLFVENINTYFEKIPLNDLFLEIK